MQNCKFLTVGVVLFSAFQAVAETDQRIFECYNKAVAAASAIDALNFPRANRTSFSVDAQVQEQNRARILVSFDESKNRKYTIRFRKNRSATLRGGNISAEPGCYVESVN